MAGKPSSYLHHWAIRTGFALSVPFVFFHIGHCVAFLCYLSQFVVFVGCESGVRVVSRQEGSLHVVCVEGGKAFGVDTFDELTQSVIADECAVSKWVDNTVFQSSGICADGGGVVVGVGDGVGVGVGAGDGLMFSGSPPPQLQSITQPTKML